MSLVAYASSDISDSEEESESEITKNIATSSDVIVHKLLNLPPPKSTNTITTYETDIKVNNLFSALPQPKQVNELSTIEDEDEFLKKKETPELKPPPPPQIRKPVRITLPALSQFEDAEEVKPAPLKAATVQPSGLLGLLPQPRQMTMTQKRAFIPYVLTKKPAPKPTPKVAPKPIPTIDKFKPVTALTNDDSSDDSDNDGTDFFSLNDDYKLPDIPYNAELESSLNKKAGEVPVNANLETQVDQDVYDDYLQQAAEMEAEEVLGLDEEALRYLCGSRAKRAKAEQIQIIDVSGKDVLPSREEWLRTALTESTVPMRSHSTKNNGGPSSQQKRKHQITYLAHQAKANEVDLQNQWANNRMTRKQTQSKYGF